MQRINLYAVLPKPVKIIVSFNHLLQICGCALVLFVLLLGFNVWKKKHVVQQLAVVREKIVIEQKELGLLTQQFPEVLEEKELQVELQNLQQEVGMRSEILHKYVKTEDRQFFSEYFQGLARVIPRGVWLQLIQIDKRQHTVIFSGKTIEPTLVPQFIQSLSRSPIFRGKKFHTFYLHVNEKDKSVLNFTIGAPAEDLKNEKNVGSTS